MSGEIGAFHGREGDNAAELGMLGGSTLEELHLRFAVARVLIHLHGHSAGQRYLPARRRIVLQADFAREARMPDDPRLAHIAHAP